MIGLLFIVAVTNLGLGYALAIVLTQGTLPLGIALPKLSLPQRAKKSEAPH